MSLSSSLLIIGVIFLGLQTLFGQLMKRAKTIDQLNRMHRHSTACHYVSLGCCALCFVFTLFGA